MLLYFTRHKASPLSSVFAPAPTQSFLVPRIVFNEAFGEDSQGSYFIYHFYL